MSLVSLRISLRSSFRSPLPVEFAELVLDCATAMPADRLKVKRNKTNFVVLRIDLRSPPILPAMNPPGGESFGGWPLVQGVTKVQSLPYLLEKQENYCQQFKYRLIFLAISPSLR